MGYRPFWCVVHVARALDWCVCAACDAAGCITPLRSPSVAGGRSAGNHRDELLVGKWLSRSAAVATSGKVRVSGALPSIVADVGSGCGSAPKAPLLVTDGGGGSGGALVAEAPHLVAQVHDAAEHLA
jgi:hypothetical protein